MKRLLKWVLIALVLGEVYSRGGRELLLGPRDESVEWGVGEVLGMWVEFPQGVAIWIDPVGRAVVRDGSPIGVVTKFDEDFMTRDMAGYPVKVARVYVEAYRDRLGWPINVAQAEVVKATHESLAPLTAA